MQGYRTYILSALGVLLVTLNELYGIVEYGGSITVEAVLGALLFAAFGTSRSGTKNDVKKLGAAMEERIAQRVAEMLGKPTAAPKPKKAITAAELEAHIALLQRQLKALQAKERDRDLFLHLPQDSRKSTIAP